ncbi:MAG TPA: FAD-dependent oxidoreductase [Candidatus Evtepia faecavium]|nr:FAD-dependent oxidoreductase [Candidatus Evtepia faecavium]
MKVVIIGGVAGGATAAARIRRLDEQAEIVMLERSGFISYANCGLPYYIGGVIQDEEALTLQTPQGFWERFRIDARVRHEATAIDPAAKTVTVKNLETGAVTTEQYDKLLLAPGAHPTRPEVPGLDSQRLFTLRTVEDTLAIRAFVEREKPRTAVLAGGGFIGLELAENLAEMGVQVTIVQRQPQVMAPLDYDMATFLHAHLRQKGITLRLGAAVAGFRQAGETITTLVEGGEDLPADLAILAVGVTPESALAKAAGLTLGARGSIAVNDRMQTSDPDIYAVGDAVEITHLVSGKKTRIALAGPANKQGRVAADNLCGGDTRYPGAQGSSVIKVCDLTAAVTGLNERAAREAGLDYEKVVLSPMNHAGYYPGGRMMTMKVLYEKGTLRILGAQIVGYEGVDKRVDVIATAMQAGLKVTDLAQLDLAYAPPYASAKDPVNMAGFMAENIEKGLVKQFHWDQVAGLPRDGSVTLLDTRTPMEYSGGCAPGFVNIPVDELRQRLGEIDKTKPVYVMCQSGLRSYLACRILAQNGYDCYNFSGGYRFYASVMLDQLAAQSAFPCGVER